MKQPNPYVDAVYRVIAQDDQTFGVEVSVPDAQPTMVTSFASEADAEAWIARHKERVQAPSQGRQWARAAGSASKPKP